MAVHFRLLLYEVHSSGRVGFLCVLRRVVASATCQVRCGAPCVNVSCDCEQAFIAISRWLHGGACCAFYTLPLLTSPEGSV